MWTHDRDIIGELAHVIMEISKSQDRLAAGYRPWGLGSIVQSKSQGPRMWWTSGG